MGEHWNFDQANYQVGSDVWIATHRGWSADDISRMVVTKVSKTGQLTVRSAKNENLVLRITPRGFIAGAGSFDRRRVVSEQAAREQIAAGRKERWFREIARLAEAVEQAARHKHSESLTEAFAALASGIEARRAETQGGSLLRRPRSRLRPPMSEKDMLAREIVNRHCEYMDGLSRGQVTMRTSNAIAAVEEALALSNQLQAEVARYREALESISRYQLGPGQPRPTSWSIEDYWRHCAEDLQNMARAAFAGRV